MTFKTKIIATFLVPAVAIYSVVAGVAYRGYSQAAFDWRALGTTAIMALLCALAQDLIPRSLKEALVFWRIRDRLPGCRAFSRETSDRYDLSLIMNIDQLRTLSGAHQQRIFYSVYKKHKDDPTVSHYSFRYVAWRDTAALFFILAVLTIPGVYSILGLGVGANVGPALRLTAFSFVAYVLTALAARQSANSLVGQVLSCETAGHPHAINT